MTVFRNWARYIALVPTRVLPPRDRLLSNSIKKAECNLALRANPCCFPAIIVTIGCKMYFNWYDHAMNRLLV